MARHVTKNAAHPTSSILGPGHMCQCMESPRGSAGEVRTPTRRRSFHRARDTDMPGSSRVIRVGPPCAHLPCAAPWVPPRA